MVINIFNWLLHKKPVLVKSHAVVLVSALVHSVVYLGHVYLGGIKPSNFIVLHHLTDRLLEQLRITTLSFLNAYNPPSQKFMEMV